MKNLKLKGKVQNKYRELKYIFYSNGKILIIFSVLNIMFLLLHLKFVIFVGSTKGLLKALGVMICCYLDSFLMLIGIVFSSISYIFGRKY